jgi:ATP-dependent DNA helicase DinG
VRSQSGDAAIEALRQATSSLVGAEERQGQIEMVYNIAKSINAQRSIVVQAGTGTGKSLGYLVPSIIQGKKTVVATATKALQDQLHHSDLPLLQKTLDKEFTWAVVKGRSNYACVQRIVEYKEEPDDLFSSPSSQTAKKDLEKLIEWSHTTETGDFEELTFATHENTRKVISVGVDECPGRTKCPSGHKCFAEKARDAANDADVIVVNLHLYGLHLASGGNILPEHEVVIFDEAHQLESVLSDTVGTTISGGRISSTASALRQVFAAPEITNRLEEQAMRLTTILSPLTGERLPTPIPTLITEILTSIRLEVMEKIGLLRELKTENESTQQKIYRAQTQSTRLVESLDVVLGSSTGFVFFVEGGENRALLKVSPLHVGDILQQQVWSTHCAVLTSATIPHSMPERVGLDRDDIEVLSVESPFDYERNSRLYCSPEFPDRNSPRFTEFVHDELEALITAAGGRTLALFTSNKALHAAIAEMRQRLPMTILTPSEIPRQKLIEDFLADESSCIFASQSFFQGIDLPGRTLSLVVLDKLPFPRPDDPLLEARREAVGREISFQVIDLPLAATSLAQAAGRLIRTANDKGVVAVLDRRLATANYWRTLIGALPPMTRTRQREEVEQFLRDITTAQTGQS